MAKISENLRQQLSELAAAEGLELLDIERHGSGPRMILRLILDSPDGVNLDQCAEVSRQSSALLDVENPFSHHYTLEVSSAGMDRKLYSEADYERFRSRRVKIRMKPSYREHRTIVGTLEGLIGDTVLVSDDSGTRQELPWHEVFEARLELDWER